MKILFLTISRLTDVSERNIYNDLMRKFRDEGHEVYIVSPRERRYNEYTTLTENHGVQILGVRTYNLIKTNIIEKGIGQVLLQRQFIKAIDKWLASVKFDLVLYTTPPITLNGVVKHLKQQQPTAMSYLMLKDIFPQNAVDISILNKTGIKGLLFRYFRRKEKELYKVSDYIGCMSPANVKFVVEHNPEVSPDKVEVAPNSIELGNFKYEDDQQKAERYYIRKKYDLPTDKPLFIYGGSLGKPQGICYLIKCLEANMNRLDCYFVVVGTGTDYNIISDWYKQNKDKNVKLINYLPKEDYDMLVKYCDVGLIFLDHRFTIPNFPSRLLSYLEYKMPVICATDPNTDVGRIAEENGFGYWCESVKVEDFTNLVDKMLKSDRKVMGEKGYQYLKENYLVEHTYNKIMSHF